MNNPNVLWSDLLESETHVKKMRRKDIQHTYPVMVRVQASRELGVQWNIRKLADWRKSNPNPLTWKPYEVQIAKHMIQVLRNSGWYVSAPTEPNFVCTIRRQYTPDAFWNYNEPECPTLVCLNDIKQFFPVIWHKLDVNNTKVYSIELYHDKIHSMALKRGVIPEILTVHLSTLLSTTLAQSPAWDVKLASLPGEFCKLIV
jgi:hypothetical protein